MQNVVFRIRSAHLEAGNPSKLRPAADISSAAALFNPILHLSTFLLGILLARWQVARNETAGPRVDGSLWHSLTGLVSAAGFLLAAALLPRLPYCNLRDGLLAPLFACAIWAFSHPRWLPARWISAPWLVILGESSYGLYLLHYPIFHWFERAGWSHGALPFGIYLAMSIGLSVLSFRFFETPMRRWILKRAGVRTKETIEAASDAQ